MKHTLRGAILEPKGRQFTYHQDGLIHIEDGKIVQITKPSKHSSIPIQHPTCVLLPGFTDAHIHFPQTNVCGSAAGPLLPWLEETVFPEEARFDNHDYARKVAKHFCEELLRSGVCAGTVFSSSHASATHILFEALNQSGLKGLAGMTLMDRNAPQNLLCDVVTAKDQMEILIKRWHGFDHDRLRYCVTPRFAISCSESMLDMAAQMSKEHQLWIQTHISENLSEIEFTKTLFPSHSDYLDVYDSFGLLHERSIYAHCIHFTDDDWNRLIEAKAVVAHCPDSNFFLGSGCMHYGKAQRYGARLSIGTDVGAGRSFSMRLATARGYDASLIRNDPIAPEELLWSATIGGAVNLGFNRSWGQGADADIVAIPVPSLTQKNHIIDAILFRHDHPTVAATYIRGKCRFADPQFTRP